jgi:hypothetical protein
LPCKKVLPSEKLNKNLEKEGRIASPNNKFEDSTASREFKLKKQDYDNPNGEYFGSKISIKYRKKSRSKRKDRDKTIVQLTKSLERKVKMFRKVQAVHSS